MTEATMEVWVEQSPEKVWALVTDRSRWAWRSDLERIQTVDETTFIEIAKGGFATAFTVTAEEPPTHWAFALENDNVRGTWTGEFTEIGVWTKLVFTERVEPKKRWMRPFLKGYLKKQQSRYFSDLLRALEQ